MEAGRGRRSRPTGGVGVQTWSSLADTRGPSQHMETFFDGESRSSFSSLGAARYSRYTTATTSVASTTNLVIQHPSVRSPPASISTIQTARDDAAHSRQSSTTNFVIQRPSIRSPPGSISTVQTAGDDAVQSRESSTTNFVIQRHTAPPIDSFFMSQSISDQSISDQSISDAGTVTGADGISLISDDGARYHDWLQPQYRRQNRPRPVLDVVESPDVQSDCEEAMDQAVMGGLYLAQSTSCDALSTLSQSSAGLLESPRKSLGDVGVDNTVPTRTLPKPTPLSPIATMTRAEFEALPPTIQRKYFSTLERLRFAQHSSVAPSPDQSYAISPEQELPSSHSTRPHLPGRKKPDAFQAGLQVDPADHQFYTSLPDKIKRLHLSEEEQVLAKFPQKTKSRAFLEGPSQQRRRQLVRRRHSQPDLYSESYLSENASTDFFFANMSALDSSDEQTRPVSEQKTTATSSVYDSFRWLEEDEDLDLRLYLDDYHINLREEAQSPCNHQRPSFRRRLSITKLPFGRASVSSPNSRPGTKETLSSPTSPLPLQSPYIGTPGHSRKKSRALSLITPNKRTGRESPSPIDPSATHYQDPEARMRLREYLGSSQKFDEALEYGFPCIDEVGDEDGKLRTFLEDDDKSSIYSDGVTTAEPESPKTPEALDKPTPLRPVRMSSEPAVTMKGDLLGGNASREMTLRMTLTRPDLRANEDNLYGWQKNTVRKSIMPEGSVSPVIFTREVNEAKEGIERQFAMMDQENTPNDAGVVKRFWNRVRRS